MKSPNHIQRSKHEGGENRLKGGRGKISNSNGQSKESKGPRCGGTRRLSMGGGDNTKTEKSMETPKARVSETSEQEQKKRKKGRRGCRKLHTHGGGHEPTITIPPKPRAPYFSKGIAPRWEGQESSMIRRAYPGRGQEMEKKKV